MKIQRCPHHCAAATDSHRNARSRSAARGRGAGADQSLRRVPQRLSPHHRRDETSAAGRAGTRRRRHRGGRGRRCDAHQAGRSRRAELGAQLRPLLLLSARQAQSVRYLRRTDLGRRDAGRHAALELERRAGLSLLGARRVCRICRRAAGDVRGDPQRCAVERRRAGGLCRHDRRGRGVVLRAGAGGRSGGRVRLRRRGAERDHGRAVGRRAADHRHRSRAAKIGDGETVRRDRRDRCQPGRCDRDGART